MRRREFLSALTGTAALSVLGVEAQLPSLLLLTAPEPMRWEPPPAETLTLEDVRAAIRSLEEHSVRTPEPGHYVCHVHPSSSTGIRICHFVEAFDR